MKKDIFGSFLVLGAFALILTSCKKDEQDSSSVKTTWGKEPDPNRIAIVYNPAPDFIYSLDVKTTINGVESWTVHCLDQGYFEKKQNEPREIDGKRFDFDGVCSGNGDKKLLVADIKELKLCRTHKNVGWQNARCHSESYTHKQSETVRFGVQLVWDQWHGHTYSFDIIYNSTGTTAPLSLACINATTIGTKSGLLFSEHCDSYENNTNNLFYYDNVKEIRICRATDWRNQETVKCSPYTPFDKTKREIKINW